MKHWICLIWHANLFIFCVTTLALINDSVFCFFRAQVTVYIEFMAHANSSKADMTIFGSLLPQSVAMLLVNKKVEQETRGIVPAIS